MMKSWTDFPNLQQELSENPHSFLHPINEPAAEVLSPLPQSDIDGIIRTLGLEGRREMSEETEPGLIVRIFLQQV
jgi:hypothetical protein